MYAMTRSHVCNVTHVRHDSFVCMCNVTHVRHDSFICMCNVTQAYEVALAPKSSSAMCV